MAVVKGAGVVGLVSDGERELAWKTCHPYSCCTAGYASYNQQKQKNSAVD
jgi:hypothetical protein